MNKKELMNKFMNEQAEERKERDKEIALNLLSQYSTAQLKKELRRSLEGEKRTLIDL